MAGDINHLVIKTLNILKTVHLIMCITQGTEVDMAVDLGVDIPDLEDFMDNYCVKLFLL